MRVLNALVIDEIRDREDGGIDLIGLREDLYFDAVPVILEALSLFVELEVAPADRGKRHTLEFRLIEADTGRTMHTASLQFMVPPDHPRPLAPLDPTLFELPFESFGAHFVELHVNSELHRRVYLNILPRTTAGES
ncbi:MAG: hypothetical protein OHK0029_26380 [Armatimonadaceae bacterium]